MIELDRLVAEYKHIADNDGEHRIADLVWLVNELIYEREHRPAALLDAEARAQETPDQDPESSR